MLEVAHLWTESEGKFTVTGSYLSDREKLPGLWREVYEAARIIRHSRRVVQATLDLVSDADA